MLLKYVYMTVLGNANIYLNAELCYQVLTLQLVKSLSNLAKVYYQI